MQRQSGFPWLGLCSLFFSVALISQSHAAGPTNEDCITCHGLKDLKSRKGYSRFIDPARFSQSVHARRGVGCLSCHPEVDTLNREARIPHRTRVEPKCRECHVREYDQYSKSLHAQVSKKLCYACHNPHYTTSFREMSGDARKKICLTCHDAVQTHRWLPQQQLHFNYLECTACHALNASIGMLLYMVDKKGAHPRSFCGTKTWNLSLSQEKKGWRTRWTTMGTKSSRERNFKAFSND